MKTTTLLKIYTEYLDSISSHVNMTRYEAINHVKMIAGNCKTKKMAWNSFWEDDGNEGYHSRNPY